MSLYKVGETWYAYITHGGQRVRRSTQSTDRQAAQRFHDELKAELWQQRPAAPETRPFRDAVAAWLETGDKGEPDRYRVRAFNLMAVPLGEIDSDLLAGVLASYQGATRNRCINLLHAILEIARSRGWIERVPDMRRIKVDDKRTRWLSAKEWRKLQSELPCHLRAMARFAIATGLRENNVIELEWAQVDMRRKVAWIYGDQAKAGRAIGVPLSDDAMGVLRAQKEAQKTLGQHDAVHVFLYAGHPITKASSAAWYKATKRAGLAGFRWHDLRHTWASWHVMAGTPLEVLQKLGGWKTLAMVTRYAHLDPGHLAKFAGNAQPRHTSAPHLPAKAGTA